MDILTHAEYPTCFAENTLKSPARKAQQKTGGAASYDAIFQSVQARMSATTTTDDSGQVVGLVELCQAPFERYFGSAAEKTYYHVMDATSISQENWCHEDFPFDKFFSDETDDSVLAWQPKRINPSQLSGEIQSKISVTLGKNAIVVPPALDEKMKDNPALREKVAANIAQAYAFHVSGGPRPMLPGTKFYGTRLYSSVVVLNENGEVEHCRVSSGGGWIGPDEKTLRQIEQEQKRKAKRKAENHLLNEMAALRQFETSRVLFQSELMHYNEAPLR